MLLEDLWVRGLLESALVVLVGEFGRSPRIVKAGRDHWPACYSALLAGAGIRGGWVHGASDVQGGYVRDCPMKPERFGATALPPLACLQTPDSRPGNGFTRPASNGEPIEELFG